MKTIYGIMGFIGLMTMIGGAGCADHVSFGKAMGVMFSGLALLMLSMLLIKIHDIRMRRKRHMYMRRGAQYINATVQSRKICRRKTPEGISMIISGKIKSLELC